MCTTQRLLKWEHMNAIVLGHMLFNEGDSILNLVHVTDGGFDWWELRWDWRPHSWLDEPWAHFILCKWKASSE